MKYWPLLVVGWIGVVWGLIWIYRRRRASLEAASRDRLHRLLGDAVPSALPVRPPRSPAVSRAAASQPGYVPRTRLLDERQAGVYTRLQAEFPGCLVLVHVGLSAVLDVAPVGAPHDRDQRSRRIAAEKADFVICGADLRPIAVLDLDPGTGVPGQARKAECLAQAGVRYVTLPGQVPVAAGALRAVVMGSS